MTIWQLIAVLLYVAIGLLFLTSLAWIARASDDHAEEAYRRYRKNT